MPSLPVSALPCIPSVFSSGDRLTLAGDPQVRDEQGRWTCERPECAHVLTDAEVRRLYTDTRYLTLFGLPLIAPAPIKADEPLPGRFVAEGESPFEADRPYLMASDKGGRFEGLTSDPGPWGIAQRAGTPKVPDRPGAWTYEMSMTDRGVVWYRAYGLTVAYIPAERPTGDDVTALMSVAVIRAAFSENAFAVRLV